MTKTVRDFFIGIYIVGFTFTFGMIHGLENPDDPLPFLQVAVMSASWPFTLGVGLGIAMRTVLNLTYTS